MDLLDKHFEVALKNPAGIKRLRDLILKLAMQGKLVPQDKNERSADLLLNEIELAKIEMLKNKFIKPQKALSEIKKEEIPYVIPSNWKWIRLENICTLITDGTHYTPDYIERGVPFLSVKNLSSGKIDFKDSKYISESEHLELAKRCNPQRNDILLTKIGTTGIAVVVDTDVEFSIFVSVALLKLVKEKVNSKFLEYLINSPLVKKYSQDGTEGVGNKNLVLRKIREFIIPFPPLQEQKRIVEKIEQLLFLCDRLEQQRDEKFNLLSKINSSAINNLIKANNESSFNEAWTFIKNQFELIFTSKKNVADLKEIILNLAMRGVLATCDFNDQPASTLLIEIETERNLLIKNKSIGNQKKSMPIKSFEKNYAIPANWQWVRLNDFGIWKSGSTPSRTNRAFYEGDIPWLKSGEVKQGRIKETSETITDLALAKCSLHVNPVGSVLIAMYGANIGEVGILDIDAATNQAVCACKTYSCINNEFLYYLLLSLKSNFISQGAGAAQPNISREKIINTVVPLPPLNEQMRIVNNIKKLFNLSDSLGSTIDDLLITQNHILNSVMANI